MKDKLNIFTIIFLLGINFFQLQVLKYIVHQLSFQKQMIYQHEEFNQRVFEHFEGIRLWKDSKVRGTSLKF